MARRFRVWLDHGYPQIDVVEAFVDVEDGEDPDAVCAEALDDMIGSELESGWCEVEPDPLDGPLGALGPMGPTSEQVDMAERESTRRRR